MPSDPSDLKVFAAPVFRGGRFDDHSIPVDVLPQFLAYKNLVRDLAMALFRKRHNRIRVPAHFEDAFQLKLQNIEKDCAVPVFARAEAQSAGVAVEPLDTTGRDGDYYDEARDLISDTIRALAHNEALPDGFPEEFLEDLLTLGKYLQDNESLEFRGPSRAAGPRYDAMVRVLIESRLAQPSYRKVTELSGTIIGFDWDSGRFRIRTLDGYYVVGTHNAISAGTLAKALNEKKLSRVRVLGEVTFTHDHIPQKISDIRRVHKWSGSNEASVYQVEERIKELQDLKQGWLDNEHGRALREEGLLWLEGLLLGLMVERYLPKPRLYATPDGEVEAEWSFDAWEVSATIDLSKKSAWMHAANVETLEDAEETLDLGTRTGVESLVAFLMQYGTFGPGVA